MHSVAAMDARRMAHKYVDGYYSRLAALRKRSENFRGTDINTVVMRLRPSETQCNTSESGASLYDVTRARSFGDDKGTDSGRKKRKKCEPSRNFRECKIRYQS